MPMTWLPQDIVLTNNTGAHGAKAEESCLMALLMLQSRLPEIIKNQQDHLWKSVFTTPIVGKTVVVVGFGDLGQGAGRAAKWSERTPMDKRPIGSSGIKVAPIALGGNVFDWTADEATSFAVLDAFVDAGGTMIDTADVYSAWVPGHKGGESEALIGRWLKRDPAKREKVVIATKVGFLDGQIVDGEYVASLEPGVVRQCDRSLTGSASIRSILLPASRQ
jgi:hypothetical protein